MMTRKTLTVLALSICFGLSLSAHAADEIHDKKGGKEKELEDRQEKKETAITAKSAELGQKLFFSSENAGAFKEFYDKSKFVQGTQTLVDGLNGIQGPEAPTLELEKANAEAIVTMFDEMTDKDAPTIVKGIWDAYKKVDEKGSGDIQYDELVKRLWDAAQLKIPSKLWPKEPPKQTADEKDPRLAKFREAFLEARDARLEFAKEFKEKIKNAPTNKAAQEALFGSKTNKDDPEANKFAVGANVGTYIRKLIAQGDVAGARELVNALTVNNKMYLNNKDGKTVAMNLSPADISNDQKLKNIFNDSKMASAQFVGHEPTGELKPVDWIWDSVTKSVIPRGESKGVGGQPSNAQDAKSAAPSNAGGAQPIPAEVSAIVSTNCQMCHGTSISGNDIVGKGGKKGSANTNWEHMITSSRLNAQQQQAMRNYAASLL